MSQYTDSTWLESLGGRIVTSGVTFARIFFDCTDGLWTAYLSTKHPMNYLNEVPNRSDVLSLFAALGISNHNIELENKSTGRSSCETPNVANTGKPTGPTLDQCVEGMEKSGLIWEHSVVPTGPIIKLSPVSCNHANESPLVCPCCPDCYCRQRGSCPKIDQNSWGTWVSPDVAKAWVGPSKSAGPWTNSKVPAWAKCIPLATESTLNLEADPGFKARALHHIVQSMHDGHCPKCGCLDSSERFYHKPIKTFTVAARRHGFHQCTSCGFMVTDSEAEAALKEFLPYLQKSVEIFEDWRKEIASKVL